MLRSPNFTRRGGGGFFAFLVILSVTAAVGLYFFYYVPGREKAANQSTTVSANQARNQPHTNTDSNTNENSSNGNENANTPENTNTPDNTNQPSNENTPENTNQPPVPSNDDAKAMPLIEAAEKAAKAERWAEGLRKANEALKLNLSFELQERGQKVQSQCDAWVEFGKVQSVRGKFTDDEPVPVQLVLTDGGQITGSIYKRVLQQVYKASRESNMPEELPDGWTSIEATPEAQQLTGEIVIARRIGGYDSVPYKNLYKIEPQKQVQADEYYEARAARLRSATTDRAPFEKMILALGLKRYAPAGDDDHPLMMEATSLVHEALVDDAYLMQSVRLERERDYQDYLQAVRADRPERAATLLSKLLQKYPNAWQLREAKASAGNAAQAAEQMKKRMAEAEERGSANMQREDVTLRGDLQKARNGPASEALSKAMQLLNEAKRYDELAMPGKSGFKENLDKAIYYYHAVKTLLERDSSEEAERIKLEANKSLFWCNKRKPLF